MHLTSYLDLFSKLIVSITVFIIEINYLKMVKYTFMMHVGSLRVQNKEAHFKNCTKCSPCISLSFNFLVWNTTSMALLKTGVC